MVPDLPPPTFDVVRCASAGEISVARAGELRRAGQPARASEIIQCVLQRYPSDADAWFELGAARAALNLRAEARAAFLRALDLAPGNDDARLGLARLAWWEGDRAGAQAWLSSVSDARSGETEARELQQSLDQAEASTIAWRADLSLTQSKLTQDLPDWTETRASLFRRDGAAGVGLSLEHARRFAREDLYVEGQATLNAGAITWSLALGGAPQADFRPRTAVRIGAEAGEGPWRVSAALTHSDYAVGPVSRLDLRLAREIDDGVQLFLQAGLVNDENGENRQGYGIGASWRLPAGPVLDGSWSDGAESAEGFTVEVQAATVGLTFEMTDDLHIRAGLTHEMREAYDRTEAGLSLVRMF